MTKKQETRVGYKAIYELLNITKEYIEAHTEDGKYIGEIIYLDKYNELYAHYYNNNPEKFTSEKTLVEKIYA